MLHVVASQRLEYCTLELVKRKFVALAIASCAGTALAQGPGSGELRTPPPAPPAREATSPGERRALDAPPVPESAAPADIRSRRAANRCGELSGALREQCLLEPQGAAAGASSLPEPRTAPPPQNPR